MSAFSIKQAPIQIRPSSKMDMRTQFGALCYRVRDGKAQILLITSRTTRRWVVPKGWPEPGLTPAEAARKEAWEEAGVEGQSHDLCLGLYSYNKVLDGDAEVPCVVMVYPVRVSRLAPDFPERGQRRRKWFSPRKASERVQEPELQRILRDFDPRLVRLIT